MEQRGIEHRPPSAPIVADRTENPATCATQDDSRPPEVLASHHPPAEGTEPSDAVEAGLAKALSRAAEAGRFDVVAQLAPELGARRCAEAGNIVCLDDARQKGSS